MTEPLPDAVDVALRRNTDGWWVATAQAAGFAGISTPQPLAHDACDAALQRLRLLIRAQPKNGGDLPAPSTDRQLHRIVGLLRVVARELWGAILSPPPHNHERMAFMRAPKVGHMVSVYATGAHRQNIDCVGKLLQHTPPLCWGDDEWIIETLDGRKVVWTNVEVLRIPTSAPGYRVEV